jgi:L-iditol 2-dehydrogenase
MSAAVYRGKDDVRMESIPVPALEPGEVLVKVAACGVCGTDLKKVQQGHVAPPRVFGHETAGTIVRAASGVRGWKAGDRVAVYHHIPDRTSWYSQRGLYAQCPRYKQTGVTAGFAPAGGGFAEYVRVMPWIVEGGGLVRVPEDVSWEEAVFVEPVNTCLKGVRMLDLDEEHVLLVAGLGSVGLILLQLALREGARVIAADPLPGRRAIAQRLGAVRTVDPRAEDVHQACLELTEGRGADRRGRRGCRPGERDRATRPGAAILLFAQTHRGDEVAVDVGDLCIDEKRVVGSYSASVDLAEEAAEIVFGREIDVASLVTHRVPLAEASRAFTLASTPADDVVKVVVHPGALSHAPHARRRPRPGRRAQTDAPAPPGEGTPG